MPTPASRCVPLCRTWHIFRVAQLGDRCTRGRTVGFSRPFVPWASTSQDARRCFCAAGQAVRASSRHILSLESWQFHCCFSGVFLVPFPTSSKQQQLSCCPLHQEHQTRLSTALFPFPFLPGFQPHLFFQARGASPWHGLLYGDNIHLRGR